MTSLAYYPFPQAPIVEEVPLLGDWHERQTPGAAEVENEGAAIIHVRNPEGR